MLTCAVIAAHAPVNSPPSRRRGGQTPSARRDLFPSPLAFPQIKPLSALTSHSRSPHWFTPHPPSHRRQEPCHARHRRAPPDPLRDLRHLTPRDRLLLAWLAEHQTLTTGQIATALFPSLRAAQKRLTLLYRIGALDRFSFARTPTDTGGLRYTLGPLGDLLHPQPGGTAQPPRPADRSRPQPETRPPPRRQRVLHRPRTATPAPTPQPACPLVGRDPGHRRLRPRRDPPRRARHLAAPTAAPSGSSSNTTAAPKTSHVSLAKLPAYQRLAVAGPATRSCSTSQQRPRSGPAPPSARPVPRSRSRPRSTAPTPPGPSGPSPAPAGPGSASTNCPAATAPKASATRTASPARIGDKHHHNPAGPTYETAISRRTQRRPPRHLQLYLRAAGPAPAATLPYPVAVTAPLLLDGRRLKLVRLRRLRHWPWITQGVLGVTMLALGGYSAAMIAGSRTVTYAAATACQSVTSNGPGGGWASVNLDGTPGDHPRRLTVCRSRSLTET